MNHAPSIALAIVVFLTISAAHADDHTSLVAPGAKVQNLQALQLGRLGPARASIGHGIGGKSHRENDQTHPGHLTALEFIPEQPVATMPTPRYISR